MRPLEGIKVVELATHVVVPAAARVMADWGAEVIKIESPKGDAWRQSGGSMGLPANEEANVLYAVYNSGKEMICLDLKTDEGRQAVLRILEDADIFCTNVRYAAIQRLGLDYETLHARFPRMIYMHFSGFGYEGPEAARPAYDTIAFFSMTGTLADWPNKGDRPMLSPPAFGDMATSNSVLSGIMAALFHRERTGEGLRVTSSLLANGIWCNNAHIIACQENFGHMKFPRDYRDNPCPLGAMYRCRDDRWLLLAGSQKDCDRMMAAFGLEQYVGDPRFASTDAMREHRVALYDILEERMAQEDCSYWEGIMRSIDIPYQKLLTASEVSKSEQAWANGYFTHTKFPNGIEAIEPNSPVKFFGVDLPETRAAGYIGDNTSAVLRRYGYSDEEIRSLMDRNIAFGK